MIKVSNLRKNYEVYKPKYSGIRGYIFKEKTEAQAIKDISFEVGAGEIVGYIGTNGAGKSTTVKILTGILSSTSGDISVCNMDPFKMRKKLAREIGVVFGQRNQLFWDLTVKDTFEFNKSIYEIPEGEFKKQLNVLNECFDLDKIYNKHVRRLSLGQRMKANFALNYLHKPKIVFLDEPTIGLDLVIKNSVREFIKYDSQKNNTTVMFTSHDISDIDRICSRVILIDEGKVKYDGDKDSLATEFDKLYSIEIKFSKDISKLEIENLTSLKGVTGAQLSGENSILINFNNNITSHISIIDNALKTYGDMVIDIDIIRPQFEKAVYELFQSREGKNE
ncbi:ABC transporter ATP-binding protein [Clostridium cylindrosporum]|uniref:ATP-binding transport protein NatA n=1 Tax=Clostridium cylindrosporum DSM 605 TaxID=1121307 RepID=A0A0J8DC86_CLOCY|nr:ATP-binding cassette domain-containing protein [Clostridium cylindrosporum]KMT21919.1 ATP-binding transport protein NatA [Clostridium cylindrosporum DSM 605]